jgi:hypothetical protein
MADDIETVPRGTSNGGRFKGGFPYDPAYFAEKHGLTLKAAKIILTAYGPSRQRCDLSAVAFLAAKAARKRHKLEMPGVDALSRVSE